MKFHNTKHVQNRKKPGFTIVEVTLALAIFGFMGTTLYIAQTRLFGSALFSFREWQAITLMSREMVKQERKLALDLQTFENFIQKKSFLDTETGFTVKSEGIPVPEKSKLKKTFPTAHEIKTEAEIMNPNLKTRTFFWLEIIPKPLEENPQEVTAKAVPGQKQKPVMTPQKQGTFIPSAKRFRRFNQPISGFPFGPTARHAQGISGLIPTPFNQPAFSHYHSRRGGQYV